MKHHTSFTHRLKSAVLWAAIFALLVGALAVTPLGANAQNRYTLKITNNSKWDIYHLYVASTEDNKWGPDQLGDGDNDTIDSGKAFTLTGFSAGEYNVKFVDEDGDSCVLKNVKIFKNESWVLTTAWLEKCEGYR